MVTTEEFHFPSSDGVHTVAAVRWLPAERPRAVVQLVVSLLGYLLFWLILPLLAALGIAIWGLVEGIVILAGGRPVDAKGVPLKD